MNRLFLAGLGFGIWLLATIAFRLAGHLFFLIDVAWVMVTLWVGTFIALFVLAIIIFNWQKIEKKDFPEAAIWLILPGMIADAFAIQFFSTVFPNMDIASDGAFGAWILMAYTSVLIAGVWRGKSA